MLYGYDKPVFISAPDEIKNLIYGLKVTWRQRDSRRSAPPGIAEPSDGETILYGLHFMGAADNRSLVFELGAKPPFLGDTFYYKKVYTNNILNVNSGHLETSDNNVVITANQLAFDIPATGDVNGVCCASTKDVTIICDFTGISEYLENTTFEPLTVEPFNVIFDVASSSNTEASINTTISPLKDNNLSIDLATTIFTNDPEGLDNSVAMFFNVNGNELGFLLTPNNDPDSQTEYIKSINGLKPINGNINIKMLMAEANRRNNG